MCATILSGGQNCPSPSRLSPLAPVERWPQTSQSLLHLQLRYVPEFDMDWIHPGLDWIGVDWVRIFRELYALDWIGLDFGLGGMAVSLFINW